MSASLGELLPAARALRMAAESRALASSLAEVGIPVLLLKGPEVQARLYGTPLAYVSTDVDILVPREQAQSARKVLEATGWVFQPDNGILWRLSRAAAYTRNGVIVDLHWGLHAAHLPARSFGALEDVLWQGATPEPSGFLVPDVESLLVFLALHVVGHRFERSHWAENVTACARLVDDWDRVWAIARASRLENAVVAALQTDGDGSSANRSLVLDGAVGKGITNGTWVLRGHFIPRRVRDGVRVVVGRLRGRVDSA